jgi:DNA (cytosine-5)-methyltransferase 1
MTNDELIVDLFAGGGGASTGIEAALGRPVDIAVNHSANAIAMHARNHPGTHHYRADVWHVSPRVACGTRPVGLLWLSPACTHFSRAKGGQNPKSAKIRSLASVAIRWAREVKPRVIILENVVEFLDWGPLDNSGKPIKSKKGRSFRNWLGKLRAQGYAVEWRTLVAADYGAPTTRKRLFLIARRDGEPITWPEPTHSKEPSLFAAPWRTAAECIDWSVPVRSIFGRKRPLAEATLRRIAAGVMRFVVANPRLFIVPVKSWGGGGNEPRSIDEPIRTVTASKRGEFAIVAPVLVSHYGQSVGRAADEPAPTVTAGGQGHTAVVAATLTKLYGTSEHGARVDAPMPTVTAGGQHLGLTAATLVQSGYGEHAKQAPRALDIAQPLGTVVAGGAKHALVSAFLTKHFGGVVGQKLAAPASTVTATDHHALTTVALSPIEHRAEVRAFLLKYYSGAEKPAKSKPAKSKRKKGDESAQGQDIRTPLHTITTRDRFALVTVDGVDYEIVDIGMRMLEPRELWRAQGFPADLDVLGFNKSKQIELCGNSVCPPVAEAIVRANFQRADGGVTHAAA